MEYWQKRYGKIELFERIGNTNNREAVQVASKGEILVHRSKTWHRVRAFLNRMI